MLKISLVVVLAVAFLSAIESRQKLEEGTKQKLRRNFDSWSDEDDPVLKVRKSETIFTNKTVNQTLITTTNIGTKVFSHNLTEIEDEQNLGGTSLLRRTLNIS